MEFRENERECQGQKLILLGSIYIYLADLADDSKKSHFLSVLLLLLTAEIQTFWWFSKHTKNVTITKKLHSSLCQPPTPALEALFF